MTIQQVAPRFLLVSADDRTPGEQVEARRKRLGMSKTQLAQEARVHRNSIAAIEAGTGGRDKLMVVEATLDRLEEEVGVDTPDLVTNTITLPDGTRVVFAGTADGVAEAAAKFLRDRI